MLIRPDFEEINKEEKEHDRVAGDYASEKKFSLLTSWRKAKENPRADARQTSRQGFLRHPCLDKSKTVSTQGRGDQECHQLDELRAVFESNLPSLRGSFLPDLAGLDVGRYDIANFIPSIVSWRTCCRCPAPSPALATAEAIYDGPHDNSSASRPSPARWTTIPAARRSAWHVRRRQVRNVCDLLSQTEGYFGYTVIIEEGLSYGIYTATVEEGARPSSFIPMAT